MPSFRSLGVWAALCASAFAQDELVDTSAQEKPNLTGPKLSSTWIQLPVDHFNDSDPRMFSNRFWHNTTFYKPGGPVFLYDYGETGVTDETAFTDVSTKGSPAVEMARQFNGIAISWEHRYFGESQPFELDTETLMYPYGADEAYKYHTIEQALEDVVFLANNLELYGIEEGSLRPSKTPWIFIGGSYPGSRAAWARVRNPEVFYASWASSAPVNPLFDGSAYFNPISRSIPRNCSNDIAAITKYIDDSLGGSDAKAKSSVQQRLFTAQVRTTPDQNNTMDYTQAARISNKDYAALLQNAWDGGEQVFQYVGPSAEAGGSFQALCDLMESWDPADNPNDPFLTTIYTNRDDKQPTAAGVAATYNADEALNAFLYAYVSKFKHGTGAKKVTSPYAVDTPSWIWLVTNEFGVYQSTSDNYFKTQTHGSSRIMSKFYDLAAFFEDEKESMPNITLRKTPDVDPLNKAYGGWDMNPSHVMFTSGEWDPWRAFTVMSEEDKLGAPVRNATEEVPACGKAPSPDTYFGHTYKGAVHCSDLGSYNASPESKHSQDLFAKALKTWLPCFKPSS